MESRPGQAPVAKEKRVPKLDRSKDKSMSGGGLACDLALPLTCVCASAQY